VSRKPNTRHKKFNFIVNKFIESVNNNIKSLKNKRAQFYQILSKIIIYDQTFHPKKSKYWVWALGVDPNPSPKPKSI